MKRRLVVLRHAKSDWPVGVADLDRPLGRRGQRDASAAGRWIAENVGELGQVWCSPARRTRQTWEKVAVELEGSTPVQFDERVYDGGLADLLAVLRETPSSTATVLLIGHNPGVQQLVLDLAERGSGDARVLAETKYPTGGLALLELADSWPKLVSGQAALKEFVVPRG